MKVDRINQSQIRFMLGRKDLEERDLSVKDLSYGSEKTKALFDDMLDEARREFNFSDGGHPLMIEAIPLADDQLMITVTRVNGPAERAGITGSNMPREIAPEKEEADDSLSRLESMLKELGEKSDKMLKQLSRPVIYIFDHFENLMTAASAVSPSLKLKNSLYREEDGTYYLMVEYKKLDEGATSVMNLMNEFADEVFDVPYGELLIREHSKPILKTRALQKLAEVENAGSEEPSEP